VDAVAVIIVIIDLVVVLWMARIIVEKSRNFINK
jgi:hypothetical protein